MALAENTYVGNGSTVLYSFTFPYLETTDIKVSLDGVITTAYTLANATTVQFNAAPTNGTKIRIYRVTNAASPKAVFYPGSTVRAQDLNSNFNQVLYNTQETVERRVDATGGTMTGQLDMSTNKIINVATPTGAADASTKGYVDGLITTNQGYATAAANSATAAASSQSAAASSASAASTSATNAGTSASAASASQSAAATSATNSANSATASATSAAASLASQTAAAASASAASTSSSNASTSASNAATSASNASTSATNAANSATSAASSAASALAAFDSFDDRYLGAKASDPSVDNDGDPLTSGDLYWNTTLSVMKVYTGSVWVIAYVPGSASNISFSPYSTIASNNVQGAIQELTDEKLNLTGGTMSGNITFNGAQTFPNTVVQSGSTASAAVPSGTTAQRDASPLTGYFRYNTTLSQFEGYNGSAWGGIGGGATGAGTDRWAVEHDNTITQSYTITSNKNVISAGPMTINSGVTVTVPTGSTWVVA